MCKGNTMIFPPVSESLDSKEIVLSNRFPSHSLLSERAHPKLFSNYLWSLWRADLGVSRGHERVALVPGEYVSRSTGTRQVCLMQH